MSSSGKIWGGSRDQVKLSDSLFKILDIGVNYEIVKKSGSWFSYGDSKLGQGRDAVKTLLEDNPELLEELETKIKEAIANS